MHRRLLPLAAALVLTAAPAAAQQAAPDARGIVYGLVGGSFGSGTFLATGAGAGLRLTRHLGLDVELLRLSGSGDVSQPPVGLGGLATIGGRSFSWAGGEDYPPLGGDANWLLPSIDITDRERDVTAFLTKFTVEFPIANGRLFPYLTGGGGVSRVTERFDVAFHPPAWARPGWLESQFTGEPFDGDFDTDGFGASVFSPPGAHSELGLSFVLGGGLDVRLWRGFGVGVDARWLRVLGSYDPFDTATLTSRISYRF